MANETLRSYRFRHERESCWRELEALIDRAEARGLAKLDAEQLLRLPVLYRAALSSLSVARSISLDKNVISYLSGLSSRGYAFVYGSHENTWMSLAFFFSSRFPALVWAIRSWVALALLIFVTGIGSGYLLTAANPDRFHSFVSEEMASGRSPLSTRDELLDVLRNPDSQEADHLSAFASFLFTHNARIGLMCFAIGFAAGVPVVLLVLINGLSLGAFVAIYSHHGLAVEFWLWLLPHGITEILAVCICAGAGFKAGHSLLFPGRLRRLDSLVVHGRRTAAIVVGCLLLFFVAALVEGFFRQLVLDDGPRAIVAMTSGVFWLWYFGPSRSHTISLHDDGDGRRP